MHRPYPTLALLVSFLFAGLCAAADWPTVHRDVARSGYTADSPAVPFTPGPGYKWVALFCLENIDSWAEPIVWQDKVLVGTYAGNLYALDRATGKTVWKYDAGGMIIGSPAVYEGTVYVGSIGGHIHAVDPATGKAKWTFHARYGFWTSPCVHRGLVMMGGRDGVFYAVDAASGELRWKYQTPRPILTTAAATDDVVIFASEDGRGYCLNLADGSLKWKTETMYAATMRGYYPIIWDQAVAFFTSPAINDGQLRDKHFEMVGRLAGEKHGVYSGRWAKPIVGNPPQADLDREQNAIIDYLRENPREKTLWAFNLSDGREKFIVPSLYTAGNEAVRNPGAVDPEGWLYTTTVSYYANWCGSESRFPYGFARFHPKTGRAELLNWASKHPRAAPGWGFTFEYDEAYNCSIGGGRVYFAHQDNIWGLELAGRQSFVIGGYRDLYGGIYGDKDLKPFPIEVGGMRLVYAPNEWHGSGRGALAICGKELFWCVGGMVICLEGQ